MGFDPRSKDLTKLSDNELHERITRVLDRMNFFSSMGNTGSYQQVANIYNDLIMEQQERIQRTYTQDEDEFSDLINVRKK